MNISKELIEKAQKCKNIDDFKALLKDEGLDIAKDEIEKLYKQVKEKGIDSDIIKKVASNIDEDTVKNIAGNLFEKFGGK